MPSRHRPPHQAKLLAIVSATILLAISSPAQTFFRLKSQGGKWWLVQGSQKMWSLGIDCTEIGDAGKPDNPNYDGRKIFGSEAAWAKDTRAKLEDWGVNTLGGWSDVKPFNGSMPYAEVLHLGAYDQAPWHDLYSAKTIEAISKAAADLVPKFKNDPNLIGYFTDNELGWWDDTLFITYFGFPADAPGKVATVESLRDYYHGDFNRLKKDWTTQAKSFTDLLQETKIALKPGSTGIKAVHAFNYKLASHYYKLVHDLIRKYDKNHLILGDRYCQYYNLETARASKDWIDVASTNAGADWLDGSYAQFYFSNLHLMTGKPVMITEFYFSARENQSGNRNTGNAFPVVQTQAERAKGFKNCLDYLASEPYIVGAHWFQFHDEPPKGRGDGEDFNFGIVDVKGQPYPLMVKALVNFNAAKVHAQPLLAKTPAGIPKAPAKPMENHLTAWSRRTGLLRSDSKEQWADLYACYDKGNVYIGVVPMEYSDANLYADHKIPVIDLPKLELTIGSWSGAVRYGDGGKALLPSGIAEASERPGLKHIVTLRIPAASLGLKSLHSGQKLHIKAILTSHGRGYRMSWDEKRTLL